MTRIIAGRARGRRLSVPPRGTRPTSDRAREAMFSAVESRLGSFEATVVLDLFSGTGALGLEALSRGASRVEFVERDACACKVINANIAAVGLPGTRCHQREVLNYLASAEPTEANVAFLDPPYDQSDSQTYRALEMVQQRSHVSVGGFVVVERSARSAPLHWQLPLVAVKDRRYGEAHIWIGQLASDLPETTL